MVDSTGSIIVTYHHSYDMHTKNKKTNTSNMKSTFFSTTVIHDDDLRQVCSVNIKHKKNSENIKSDINIHQKRHLCSTQLGPNYSNAFPIISVHTKSIDVLPSQMRIVHVGTTLRSWDWNWVQESCIQCRSGLRQETTNFAGVGA